MTPFDYRPRTRIVFGLGEFARLGEIARDAGGARCFFVADRRISEGRHGQEAVRSLKARRMDVASFHDFTATPTPAMIEAGRVIAAAHNPDIIVAMGSASALEAAKAINVVLMNGGSIADYRGYGRVAKPLLPMVAVPTVAGSGSEALTNTIVFDPHTRSNLTCGDPKIYFRTVLLDAGLTLGLARETEATSGYLAIANAVEALASPRRTPLAECFAHEAWRLLDANFERAMHSPEDIDARGALLLGAHFAGAAVENSSLGSAHACAAPITANFGLVRGAALALVLPAVLEWQDGNGELPAHPERLRELRASGRLAASLQDAGVPEASLPRLAEEAATQWTGRMGPRAFDAQAAMEIYQAAYKQGAYIR